MGFQVRQCWVILTSMSSDAAEAVAAMIASRAQERVQRATDRQAAAAQRADTTAELRERRRHGLIARHRAKLSRTRLV